MSLIGIIVSLVGLMFACMKGISVVIAAPLFALLVALTGGLEPVNAILEVYMGGTVGFAQSFFIMFLLGAVFGKIMEDSGAAKSVGNWVISKIGAKNAIIAVVLAAGALAYGGVSVFVVAFTMYPLALGVFKEANLPKRFIAGTLALGSFTFAMTALPGTPQIQNIIPTTYLGTNAMSAPFIGVVGGTAMVVLGTIYLNRQANKAMANGEVFHATPDEEIALSAGENDDLPNVFLSVLPLLIVIITLNMFGLDINVALLLGVLAAGIMFYKRIDNFKTSLNKGASSSIIAIMNTSAAVGFGTMVGAVAGFDTLVYGLEQATFGNAYFYGALSTNLLAGVTGSASGGLGIALEALSTQILTMNPNPDVLHRLLAMASGGLDALPHNGAILTLLAITGLTHKESYKDIFMVAIVFPVLVGFTGVIFATIFM